MNSASAAREKLLCCATNRNARSCRELKSIIKLYSTSVDSSLHHAHRRVRRICRCRRMARRALLRSETTRFRVGLLAGRCRPGRLAGNGRVLSRRHLRGTVPGHPLGSPTRRPRLRSRSIRWHWLRVSGSLNRRAVNSPIDLSAHTVHQRVFSGRMRM